MKKTSIFFAVLIMLLCFAGCGQNETDPSAGTSASTSVEENISSDEVSLRGTVNENTYENKTFGIGLKLSDDWYFYTDEEIASTYNYSFDELEEDTKKSLESADIIYDMIAMDASTGNNININIENMGVLYGAIYDEEKYLNISLDSYPDIMTQLGATDINAEISSATIAGQEHAIIKGSCKLNGVALYQTVLCVKKDSHMCCITLSSYNSDIFDTINSCFYSI